MFRQFLYLDSSLVSQFLAQVEGGLYDETLETNRQSGKGGLAGGLRVPVVEVHAEKSSEHSSQDERRVHQTPESQFNRLYGHLEGDGLLVVEGIDHPDYLTQLPRGSLLEIHDVQLAMSGFQKLGSIAKQATDMADWLDDVGVDIGTSEVDRTKMRQAARLDDPNKPLGVIGSVPGSAKVQLALELDRAALAGDVDGEATVLIKVTRVLKPGQTHLVGDITGGLSDVLPRAQRRKMVQSLGKSSSGGPKLTKPEIRHPGLVATAVAIYR